MCPTITVGSFFRHESSFFVYLFNNLKPQQLQTSTTPTSEARPKRKKTKQTSTTSKTHKRSHLSPTFFRHYATFFKIFWIAPEGPPSFVSIFCNTMDVKKLQRNPFYIFRHCDTVRKSHLKNFMGNFFMSPRGPPFNFFEFFATSWSFTKPEGSLF